MGQGPIETAEPTTGPGDEVVARLVGLRRDTKGQLIAELAGRDEPVEGVRLARAFPWSLPKGYISVRDDKGEELVLLETLEGLADDIRDLIDEELRDKVFAPVVKRIASFKEHFGITTVVAETDRGEVTFQLRRRDDVRALSPIRCIMKDVDGNMYEVTDVTKLDLDSQKHLDNYF